MIKNLLTPKESTKPSFFSDSVGTSPTSHLSLKKSPVLSLSPLASPSGSSLQLPDPWKKLESPQASPKHVAIRGFQPETNPAPTSTLRYLYKVAKALSGRKRSVKILSWMPKSVLLPNEHSIKPEKFKAETKGQAYKRLLGEVKSYFKNRNKRMTLERMKELIVTTTYYNDFTATGSCFIICGLIEYFYRDYGSACEYLRNVANTLKDNTMKLIAYKYLGMCFHHLGMYEYSLKCFKKQLDLAWEIKDVTTELEAYDHIGMEYYYLGDVDRAAYYHDRMMRSNKESIKSELRQHRHKFVYKFMGRTAGINFDNLQEVLKGQYQKYYSKPNDPSSPTETNYFSVSTQRFFTIQRQQSVYTTPSESRDFTTAVSKPAPTGEALISATPADLSLSDLPSPRVHYDHERENARERKKREGFFRCPAVVSYINKKIKRMQPIAVHRRKSTQKEQKILSVREGLAKWQNDMAQKKRAHWSAERITRGPNYPIVVTHLSPSRSNKRPYYDRLIKTIYKAFDTFPEGTKMAFLHKT